MILYFVDNSIHQIPSFIYITLETGGKVLTNGEDSYKFIKKDFPGIDVELLPSREAVTARAKELKPKAIVQPDFTHQFFTETGAKQVQVFHGISDKNYNFKKHVLKYDLVLFSGQKMLDQFNKKGLLPNMTFKLVGYPKLDRIYQGKLDQKELQKMYGLELNKPTVLYAPTWNDQSSRNSSIPKYGEEVLTNVPDNINLVVKLHPNTKRWDKENYSKLEQLSAKKPNILFLDYIPDIIPIMAGADLLIGDVSSVTYEYLAFQRPMVFLDSGKHLFQKKFNTWIWQTGDKVRKRGQVWPTVLERLQHPEKYADIRKRILDYIFYKPDGNAAKRAAKAIYEMV